MSRRQVKVLQLCKLIQPALAGLGERLKDQEPDVARAFQTGATVLGSDELTIALRLAADSAAAGSWGTSTRRRWRTLPSQRRSTTG